ncbi:hypothetical protein GW17_00047030 [Ensete ventricosum]|uniref:Uncharacterized protein n=1 Tax=Ensete ventricosum TaxID=4639 RepID=A0A427B013_ENSVE|nr:hypothetical protein B296_00008822 [Ensete ventricosum]RWV90742.1 hypothetical protein GW17_00047029 [Ensete ventricosum]RWV90745.1 hypothetical protein GW17_00047030 [Ensete ventricosum]RZS08102.1 hypothetical protein BHM03_00039044 [Ensete ventricosum]RZS08103.1 hypothetical protein BHM03_00039045 [Ensete ventricosum]
MASRCSTMMLALLLFCLVMTAQSTKYSLHQDRVCDFRGTCKTVADCGPICQAAGHSPTKVMCVPNLNGGDSFICCCRVD